MTNNLGPLTFEELEKLCDDPRRRVKAIFEKNDNGFAFFAQVNGLTRSVTNNDGTQMTFPAIEHAFSNILRLKNLSPEVTVKLSQSLQREGVKRSR